MISATRTASATIKAKANGILGFLNRSGTLRLREALDDDELASIFAGD